MAWYPNKDAVSNHLKNTDECVDLNKKNEISKIKVSTYSCYKYGKFVIMHG